MKKVLQVLLAALFLAGCIMSLFLSKSLSKIGGPQTIVSVQTMEKVPIPTLGPRYVPTITTPVVSASYNGFTSHVFTDAQGNTLRYYFYIPAQYDPNKKYPLVLLLHGGGERSISTNTPLQNEEKLLNDPYALVWSDEYTGAANPHIQQHWPCFVVIPQLRDGQYWVNVPVDSSAYVQPAQPSEGLLTAKELLDTLQKEYSGIDAHRLYITGLSLGGLGTWDAIERWPSYFAAAVPVSGAGDPSKAPVLKNLPIWAFHGAEDTTVPTQGSRNMITAIRASGGLAYYTEFPDRGHEIWDLVYGYSSASTAATVLYPWLFSQHT